MNGADTMALERARPMTCAKCGSVGTIVELGVCCRVKTWALMGPYWDLKYCPEPPPPPRRAKPKRIAHG